MREGGDKMPPEDTWDTTSGIASDAMDRIHRAMRGVDINDPNNPVAGAIANIQKQMNNISRSIANAQSGVYANGGVLGNSSSVRAGNITSGSILGSEIEERMTMEKIENQMKDERLSVSSHVRNRILRSMGLQRHPETTLIHTVTMYKDPSHKWNDVFYLVVNGGHRVAKWDVDGSVMTVLDEELCTLPARSAGMKKTVRLDGSKDEIEYDCGVMNWLKFVQYFAKAFTYSELPTLNHNFASNEFAEGSTDEAMFQVDNPSLPDTAEVILLTHGDSGKVILASLESFEGTTRKDLFVMRQYKSSGRTNFFVRQEYLRDYSQDVYDKVETVLRSFGMEEFNASGSTSFETAWDDRTPVNIAEQIMNIIVGFDEDRKNYATEFSYVVYRNKIRN